MGQRILQIRNLRHRSVRGVLVVLVAGGIVSACKQRAHEHVAPELKPRAAERSAPAAQVPAAPVAPPVQDPFALPDDAPIDPAEELRALRHNCCDEMPANQVRMNE